jgi:hypothetical protein
MMPPQCSFGVPLDVAAEMAVVDVAVGRLVGLPLAVVEEAAVVEAAVAEAAVEEAAVVEAAKRRLEVWQRHHRKLVFIRHSVCMFVWHASAGVSRTVNKESK